MTIKELIKLLSVYPDGYSVILSKDSEGNGFSKASEDLSVGHYEPTSEWSGDFYHRGDDEFFNDQEDAVVLWPEN